MIKGILFDLGGVLIDLDRETSLRAFHEQMGCHAIDAMMNMTHQAGIYGEMEAGRAGADEFRSELLHHSRPGCTPEDVDRCLGLFTSSIAPDKVLLLKGLSGRYPLYLLSNNNPISMHKIYSVFCEAGLSMEEIFKDQFISYRMNMLKPSAEIYIEAARRTGVSPEELLFVDDSMSNVSAARAVGMNAVYYQVGTELRACVAPFLDE